MGERGARVGRKGQVRVEFWVEEALWTAFCEAVAAGRRSPLLRDAMREALTAAPPPSTAVSTPSSGSSGSPPSAPAAAPSPPAASGAPPDPLHRHRRVKVGDDWVSGVNVGVWECSVCRERLAS